MIIKKKIEINKRNAKTGNIIISYYYLFASGLFNRMKIVIQEVSIEIEKKRNIININIIIK